MVLHFNYNCQLCKQNFNNCVALTAHLKFKHKNEMSYETYYLKYMNTKSIPGECVICGMPTKFVNLNAGYAKTCSKMCGVQLNIKNQKINNYAKAKLTRSITLKNKKIQEKIEKTLFKKYGYKKIYEIPEFIKKKKEKNKI